MISKEILSQIDKERQELYTYWDHTPAILERDHSIMEKIDEAIVRNIILKILRDGMEEEIDGRVVSRHVLSAKELLNIVNSTLEKPLIHISKSKERTLGIRKEIKISNIYFHLERLQEYDLVGVVKIILEGRHKVTYFARKAKLFLFSGGEDFVSKKMGEMIEVIKILNPQIERNEIKKKLNLLLEYEDDNKGKYMEWFENNQERLKGVDFNPEILLSLFELIFPIEPLDASLLEEFRKLFSIE